MPVAESTALRRVAIVVAALGPEAEPLLAQLPRELAEAVRQQASSLTLTGSDEEEQILADFLRACGSQRTRSSTGLSAAASGGAGSAGRPGRAAGAGAIAMEETTPRVAPSPLGDEKQSSGFPGWFRRKNVGEFSASLPAADEQGPETKTPQFVNSAWGENRLSSPGPMRPFDRLRVSEAAAIARILATERPQTVALVLSHLPPEQAGQVLSHFPPAQQVEIIHRLVDLEETDPEILRDIERTLEMRLAQIVQAGKRRRAGMTAVRNILASADRTTRGQLLSNLEVFDRELARQLAPPLPQFEDLILLDEMSLRALVQAAEPLVLQLALVGAPEVLVRRVSAVLSPPERNLLERRLEELGPTALRDIDEARDRLCRLAQQLAMRGQIDPPAPGIPADVPALG